MDPERQRMLEMKHNGIPWQKWGPYLSGRQWGTVREDYSPDGEAWEYTTHDMARSKAYRWGEEGIGGICDQRQFLCFALALWNKHDPILKERYFGLSGKEGNHGEDVKEYYYYLDNTPTHSYMKMLYKYPQQAYPYNQLVAENRRRTRQQPEYELIDTGIFNDNRYFDIFIEYAKNDADDLLIQITAFNRAPQKAELYLIPQLWFRNFWSWGKETQKPGLRRVNNSTIEARHAKLGKYYFYFSERAETLFCENESNTRRLYGVDATGYFKDGINDYIVRGIRQAVNPAKKGTRAGLNFSLNIAAGKSGIIRLRLSMKEQGSPFRGFNSIFAQRKKEADRFYARLQAGITDDDAINVQRQAYAGMLWSKQFYYYNIREWLQGDPGQPTPPSRRLNGRNHDWIHLNNRDIISMPDKWEYPWYASWDLAFHCIPLALIDGEFAKNQLIMLTREWYMHPNGQLPAYEWDFGDVNPPVHAWAAWRVYKIDKKHNENTGDIKFLERVFHKLLLNFTWWVNRKDEDDLNIFQGGFLGLDNIGIFDRNQELPGGGHIEQSDGTSWMAMFCLNMMRIALELAQFNPVYQDLALKFFEHFLYIARAMMNMAGKGLTLWDEEDEFYYDVLHCPGSQNIPIRVRSMVGLIPLFAVQTLEPEILEKLPEFKKRLEWVMTHEPELAGLVSRWHVPGKGERRLLSLLRGHRMKKLLARMLDESEFLSDYGVRALSKYHKDHPYVFNYNNREFRVNYEPGESVSAMFGGNSNWRGPIWFPVNYLIIESLQNFHHYYGDDFKVECPTGSGKYVTINDVAEELATRLHRIFLRDENGRRAVSGDNMKFQTDPNFNNYLWFYEYFHGDNGRGVGASHQTGWTGLIAKLIQPRKKE